MRGKAARPAVPALDALAGDRQRSMGEDDGEDGEELMCMLCEEKADGGCLSCLKALCEFCAEEHLAEPRFALHQMGTLEQFDRARHEMKAFKLSMRKQLAGQRAAKARLMQKALNATRSKMRERHRVMEELRRQREAAAKKNAEMRTSHTYKCGARYFGVNHTAATQALVTTPHGLGKYYRDEPGGELMYDGRWKNGQMHGQGTYFWKNGTSWKGLFDHDMKMGGGEYTDTKARKTTTYYWRDRKVCDIAQTKRGARLSISLKGRWRDCTVVLCDEASRMHSIRFDVVEPTATERTNCTLDLNKVRFKVMRGVATPVYLIVEDAEEKSVYIV